MDTLKLKQIIADPNQPRKYFAADKMGALKKSIEKHGIMSPLVVEDAGEGKYLLVDGERRFRAATELGLKEIPVIFLTSKDPISRMIEQFHLQETHEGWTPTEKAQVIFDLAEQAKMSIEDLCTALGVSRRTITRYLDFGKLATSTRNKMIENQVAIEHAEGMNRVKAQVKKIRENIQGKPFTKADEVTIEKACLTAIKEQELVDRSDYSKLRDSFTMNPKLIDKFIAGSNGISEMYVESNAKSAYNLRNLVNNANFAQNHANAFLANPAVKVDHNSILALKRAVKVLKEVIALVGEDGE